MLQDSQWVILAVRSGTAQSCCLATCCNGAPLLDEVSRGLKSACPAYCKRGARNRHPLFFLLVSHVQLKGMLLWLPLCQCLDNFSVLLMAMYAEMLP